MTDAETAAQLTAWFGPTVARTLTTAAQRAAAHRIHRMIADTAGGAVATMWMVGMNPHLGDQAPFDVIADGRGRDVEAAARGYLNGATT
ncbi:hypothetical protein ABZW44_22445 [Streptomyces mirabilis]|uniref:hypothetical protein n=1 Tax=Streptomyces mirabilis TaxID=68239 RepID=UPI0033BBDEA7